MVFIKGFTDWCDFMAFLVPKETNEAAAGRPVIPVHCSTGRAAWYCRIRKAGYSLFLQDARELFFENIKPLPDVVEVPAARENDLS